MLITRRALHKATWPGVWTNSCCGHPLPGEDIETAARRRVSEELGLEVTELLPAVPDFRYRAVDASGIVENEFCPVFIGHVSSSRVAPDPDEVAEHAWVRWEDLVAAITATPSARRMPLRSPLIIAGWRRGCARARSESCGPITRT